jgi:IclR family KDG regulon transcriptional repressor
VVVHQKSENAIQKAFAVLATLAGRGGGASLTDLVSVLDYPTSTLHRLLQELVTARFVVQDPMTKLYWIGPEITRIAHSRPQDELLRAVARPALQRLANETGETVFVSTREGFQLLSVDCVLSGRRLLTWGEPGALGPLHATAQGKAVLSGLERQELQRTVHALPRERYTEFTLTDPAALLKDVLDSAQRGFAVNDQEHDEGTVSIAVPVLIDLPSGGRWTCAVSIGAPMNRLPLDVLIERHLSNLIETAGIIEKRMAEVVVGRQFPDRG